MKFVPGVLTTATFNDQLVNMPSSLRASVQDLWFLARIALF
jgi:hypothetical protein